MPRLKIAKFAAADMSIRFLLLDQIKMLQEMGHEVIALCAPGKWVEEVRSLGVTVETVDIEREAAPLKDLRTLVTLRRLFRNHRFDVVHTHTPKAGVLGPIAAKMAGVPIVVHTIHGLLFHDRMPRSRQALFRLPEKITATFSDYLLSQSRADVGVAVSTGLCSPSKIRYLGNGIDISTFSPAAKSAARERIRSHLGFTAQNIVIGAAGRLVYGKGFAEFFAAAEALTKKNPNLRFLVIGPEETQHSRAVHLTHLKPLIDAGILRLTGFQKDMAAYFSAMDIFVLPSHREGMPRVCLEASAMELPVIATDIRGCREVVKDGETGILVGVRNASELANAIEALANDPARAAEMGKRGREYVRQNFDQRQVLERLREFYREIESKMESKQAGL
jgi:glycosyltransferase involved in cell wall biosynthesis